jgi:hypothetical protein
VLRLCTAALQVPISVDLDVFLTAVRACLLFLLVFALFVLSIRMNLDYQKIKVISRSEEKSSRECRGDVVKVHRNTDAKVHPFERAREVRLCASRVGGRGHVLLAVQTLAL